MKAINEAIRVCKKGGIIFFAYITNTPVVFYMGVVKNDFKSLEGLIKPNGALKNVPEEIFSCHFPEEFERYFKGLKVKKITQVAADSIFDDCREMVDKLSKKDFEKFLNWHLSVCERPDQLGWSSHVLYICKKQ